MSIPSSIPSPLAERLAQTSTSLEVYFAEFVSQQNIPDDNLKQAIEYALLSGGKRMRPLLVSLVGDMLSIDNSELCPLALALECIHAYSLVHDDLPAMDDDDLRRGNPTCHIKYGQATAILAGDALQCMAFEILASASLSEYANNRKAELVVLLSKAAGASGMVGGQSLDLAATNKLITISELTQLHSLKTGALIHASVLLPCIISTKITAPERQLISKFAQHIGLAFQIQDDILDVTSDTKTLGKPQGSDEQANKSTFVSILGIEGAIKELQKQHELALNALSSVNYNTHNLKLFTDFMITRTY